MRTKNIVYFIIIAMVILSYHPAYPHCDTMDGPVIKDAKLALKENNVNYVLKWVQPSHEKEVRDVFLRVNKVRDLGADARTVADNYFFDVLVRIHRAGEGVPFTGVKPSGTAIDEKVLAADKSIETGNLEVLEKRVPEDRLAELRKLFQRVMQLKNYDVNNLKAAREYVEAYVTFFHYAEGHEEGHAHGNEEIAEHLISLLPLIFSGLFLVTTVIFGVLYFRLKKTK